MDEEDDDVDADDDGFLGAVGGRVAMPGAWARELGRGGGLVVNGREGFRPRGLNGEILVDEDWCC